MLLILSEDSDYSTIEVIDWLLYNNTSFVRINGTSTIQFKIYKLEMHKQIGLLI